jgi:hypothetical protein
MRSTYLIIDSSEINYSEYDYVDYLLDIEYNSSPSSLIDIPVSEQDLGNIAYYDALGGSIKEHEENNVHNVPLGKLVV